MSELREDPLTGRKVLVAENRRGRPNEFVAQRPSVVVDTTPRADCVFCPGNEALTPDPTLELYDEQGQWQVRAFANKYPAVDAAAGQGVHEVIVESRDHFERTGQLCTEQLARVLDAYADRLSSTAGDSRFPYRLLFKNVGVTAGASIAHLHSQFIALPFVPPAIKEEAARLADWRRGRSSCGWGERLAEERSIERRIVADTGRFVAFCPSASRQPFETWILPSERAEEFESSTTPSDRRELAEMLLPVVRAIEAETEPSGYNLMVQTGPASQEGGGDWHWRIEIVPRVASLAGLELATGLFMNVLSPERAAETLRRRIAANDRGQT